MHRDLGSIDGDLLVVHADAGAVGVGVGKNPAQQHFIGTGTDPRHEVTDIEGRLLDLGVVVGRIAVQRHPADFDQRIVRVRPDLGQVERVEAIGLGLVERHDLHSESPTRIVLALDRLIKVAYVVVAVDAGQPVSLRLSQEVDTLLSLEMVFHPKLLTLGVDPHVSVARKAVHLPPGLRNAAVAHQPGHLVSRLRGQRPEVPLHVMVAQVAVGAALLGTDEVLELHRIADEEYRRVVPDHVVVALTGVELQRETPRVAPRVGAAALAGHG